MSEMTFAQFALVLAAAAIVAPLTPVIWIVTGLGRLAAEAGTTSRSRPSEAIA